MSISISVLQELEITVSTVRGNLHPFLQLAVLEESLDKTDGDSVYRVCANRKQPTTNDQIMSADKTNDLNVSCLTDRIHAEMDISPSASSGGATKDSFNQELQVKSTLRIYIYSYWFVLQQSTKYITVLDLLVVHTRHVNEFGRPFIRSNSLDAPNVRPRLQRQCGMHPPTTPSISWDEIERWAVGLRRQYLQTHLIFLPPIIKILSRCICTVL